jgi:transmembrane sensor
MSAGSQLVAPDDADWRLTRTNVARETSWLRGQIVFDDERLGDIVAELNRYSTRKIIIADEGLADRRLSGLYKPGSLDSFSRALRTYGVGEVREEPNGDVRVVAIK